MAKRLKEVLKRLDTPVGNGNAGLASNFIDLAHVKVKPGGVLALVLPAVCVSGGSWKDVRDLLAREYEDVTVLTIATHGQTDRAFSADTGMAEALIVATKCRDGRKGNGKTLFVNFYHRPRSLVEAVEMARAVRGVPPHARHGRLYIGDHETIGTYIRAPLRQGGCASLRETALAHAAIGLTEGTLRLPQGYTAPLPTICLGDVGERGLLDRDIAGKTATEPREDRLQKSPFRACLSIRCYGATTRRVNAASSSPPIAKAKSVPVATTSPYQSGNAQPRGYTSTATFR